jgi:Ca-activated chloride channel family protein
VAEYYLRLAGRGQGRGSERDAEEARRTFGEIVEFAPEDPLARRRLGDLLRAHGFYAEALRQYENGPPKCGHSHWANGFTVKPSSACDIP